MLQFSQASGGGGGSRGTAVRSDPWMQTQAQFLGPTKTYDMLPWAEEWHLEEAQNYDRRTLREIAPGYAVARIKGQSKNVALLNKASGEWYAVGAYRGSELGISASHQGKGLSTELILEASRARRGSFNAGNMGFSPAGLAAHKKAHRAAVVRAVTEGKPVPAKVLRDYPDIAKRAR